MFFLSEKSGDERKTKTCWIFFGIFPWVQEIFRPLPRSSQRCRNVYTHLPLLIKHFLLRSATFSCRLFMLFLPPRWSFPGSFVQHTFFPLLGNSNWKLLPSGILLKHFTWEKELCVSAKQRNSIKIRGEIAIRPRHTREQLSFQWLQCAFVPIFGSRLSICAWRKSSLKYGEQKGTVNCSR